MWKKIHTNQSILSKKIECKKRFYTNQSVLTKNNKVWTKVSYKKNRVWKRRKTSHQVETCVIKECEKKE